MTVVLETVGLNKRFGALTATRDVSLRLEAGARQALIGPNGAGKTTLINLLTGVLHADSGQILLAGHDISRAAPHRRARRGMARTFQISQLFADLSPLETVALAVSERRGLGRQWWRALAAHAEVRDEAATLLRRFGLGDALDAHVGSLPYGKQRLLEIAIAIAGEPRVLLLDEPAAGVPEAERHEILSIVATLPPSVAVLLIEHDMDLVFSFARRISVLVDGALFAEGPPDEVARDPRVRAAYLGEAAHG
ncbi:MAG TPA: ABC transporter ATP-binding protein [Vineibacter sp.]|nr:ABC transporter ATP-binding protein [Vineibacter sp.]